MQAFLAIVKYDLGLLVRSWVTRVWIALILAPALFLVAVAATEHELASETMGAYVAAILAPFSALAVAVLASSAVSGEADVVVDSILSRSITRTEYLLAKVTARMGFTLAVYVAVMVPFAYLVMRYAAPDTSLTGVAAGLLMVAVLLVFLAAFGITVSTVVPNLLAGVLIVLFAVLLSGVVLQFLGLDWLSTTRVIERLPRTFRGETPLWQAFGVLLVFGALSAVALAGALWVFRRKDL